MSRQSFADEETSSVMEVQSSIGERTAQEVAVGVRVRVLPGRQFPAFGAGECGVVCRLDVESRTCDVLFDGHAGGPVPVSMRHLCVERSGAGMGVIAGEAFMSSAREHGKDIEHTNGDVSGVEEEVTYVRTSSSRRESRGSVGGRMDETTSREVWVTAADNIASGLRSEDLAGRIANLEGCTALQQRVLANLEARVAACESANSVQSPGSATAAGGQGTGRLVAARVAALEGAHQAEVSDLRRALDNAMNISREYENLQKKHRSTLADSERQLEEAEQRAAALRRSATSLREEMERMGNVLEVQERKAGNLEEAVSSSGATIARLGAMLEGKERRTSELGLVLSKADETIGRISTVVDNHSGRIHDIERRAIDGAFLAGERADLEGSPGKKGKDNGPVWQALRELQELVVHESEHRAAGLREVLGVLGQGVEQLRTEQARGAEEIEARNKAEHRRTKQKLTESQLKHTEQEKRADALDLRIDAVTQALAAERVARSEAIAWVEQQIRSSATGATAAISAHAAGAEASLKREVVVGTDGGPLSLESVTSTVAPGPTQVVTSQSLQRLEALEARYEIAKGTTAAELVAAAAAAPPMTPRTGTCAPQISGSADGPLGKLKGQLEGLRTELVGSISPPRSSRTDPLNSVKSVSEATLQELSQSRPASMTAPCTLGDSMLSSTTVRPGTPLGQPTTVSYTALPPQVKGMSRCASAPTVKRVDSTVMPLTDYTTYVSPRQPLLYSAPSTQQQWTAGMVSVPAAYSVSELASDRVRAAADGSHVETPTTVTRYAEPAAYPTTSIPYSSARLSAVAPAGAASHYTVSQVPGTSVLTAQQSAPSICLAPVTLQHPAGEVGVPTDMMSASHTRVIETVSTPTFVTYGQVSRPSSPLAPEPVGQGTSELFAALDSNHDGVISRSEWNQAVASHPQVVGSVLRPPARPALSAVDQKGAHEAATTPPTPLSFAAAQQEPLAQLQAQAAPQNSASPFSFAAAAAAAQNGSARIASSGPASFGASAVEGPILPSGSASAPPGASSVAGASMTHPSESEGGTRQEPGVAGDGVAHWK